MLKFTCTLVRIYLYSVQLLAILIKHVSSQAQDLGELLW